MSTTGSSNVPPDLSDVFRRVRLMGRALLALALASYALAYYVWVLGQTPGALVIAAFGYLVLRSRARLAATLTWRMLARRPAYAPLLAKLDETVLAGGERAARERLRGEQDGDRADESRP